MAFGQIVLLVYALLIALGGLAGWKIARSRASLISGLASGASLLIAFGLTFGDEMKGYVLGAVLAFALAVLFFVRYKRSKKIMPSLMLSLFSVVATGCLIYAALTIEKVAP